MNHFKSVFCFLIFNLLILNHVLSQSSKVWVTILNDEYVPFYTTDRKLISKDSVFNNYINLLGISSCNQALPSSKNKMLLKVYELSSNSSQYELENTLQNFVSAVTGVYPAPVYDTLQTPNDYNIVPGINNYALDLINAQLAWDITQGDSNVVVAIIDQSYNPNHSELLGKYVYMNAGTATTTHGNAVAILAAGKTNNNNGLSSIGYNCKLALHLMNFNEILNAAYAGRKVINMSWTSGCFYNYYAEQVINEAYSTGAFLVASAGNGSTCGNPSSYVYPAAYDKVFSVTSIGPLDNHMRIPNDTNSTHQHNDKVDLSAPGYDVAVNPQDGWFIQNSGTSYAAPIVSGTVGLMLSVNPCLSQKDIDTILRITAVNIDTLNPTYIGKLGAGRLNAQAAVQAAAGWPSQPMTVLNQPLGVAVALGGTAQFTVTSYICQFGQ
jgi:subtilisin family serine protease